MPKVNPANTWKCINIDCGETNNVWPCPNCQNRDQETIFSDGDRIRCPRCSQSWNRLRCPKCKSTTPIENSGLPLQNTGFCFIATAAYGSPYAQEVELLRQFRDLRLRESTLGRLAIRAYESTSPPIAQWIAKRISQYSI